MFRRLFSVSLLVVAGCSKEVESRRAGPLPTRSICSFVVGRKVAAEWRECSVIEDSGTFARFHRAMADGRSREGKVTANQPASLDKKSGEMPKVDFSREFVVLVFQDAGDPNHHAVEFHVRDDGTLDATIVSTLIEFTKTDFADVRVFKIPRGGISKVATPHGAIVITHPAKSPL